MSDSRKVKLTVAGRPVWFSPSTKWLLKTLVENPGAYLAYDDGECELIVGKKVKRRVNRLQLIALQSRDVLERRIDPEAVNDTADEWGPTEAVKQAFYSEEILAQSDLNYEAVCLIRSITDEAGNHNAFLDDAVRLLVLQRDHYKDALEKIAHGNVHSVKTATDALRTAKGKTPVLARQGTDNLERPRGWQLEERRAGASV